MRTRDIVPGLIPNPQSLIPGASQSLIPRASQSLIPGFRCVGNALVAALLAPACAVCNDILEEPVSGCVCRNCWAAVRVITPPLCDRCGDPLPRPIERCRQCSHRRSVIDGSRAIGEYAGSLREIIHALKYNRRRSLARPLADLMRFRGMNLLERADHVVPVPLHWRREYHRGFNQARELARHLELPLVDALARTRNTRAQIELAAERRRANVQSAFGLRRHWLRKRPSIEGANVLLIDDVSTTGATLEACATALKEAGAAAVYALTAARVVTRRTADDY
jgi:ComF family protein